MLLFIPLTDRQRAAFLQKLPGDLDGARQHVLPRSEAAQGSPPHGSS